MLFSVPQTEWEKHSGGQQITWQREIESATVDLSRVGSSRLPSWGPKDSSTWWLDTSKDVAMNREQLGSGYYFSSGPIM